MLFRRRRCGEFLDARPGDRGEIHPLSDTPLLVAPTYAESAISVVEGTTDGVVVADSFIQGWKYLLPKPIRFEVKKGRLQVETISSDIPEQRLKKVATLDEMASNCAAELGIGTSHIVSGFPTGYAVDKGRLGHIHIAFGRNNDIGGKTSCIIHQDSDMTQATIVMVVAIMENGVLRLENQLEMERKKEMSTSEEFDRVTNAYRAAIDLRKLGSDQVHSRLTAMLTSNTIIIAVSGLAITSQTKIPADLIVALISGGLMLCLVWGFFVFHGLQVENYYRIKTEEFEPMAIPSGKQLAIRTKNWKAWGYGIATYFTIAVFMAIYSTLLFILLSKG